MLLQESVGHDPSSSVEMDLTRTSSPARIYALFGMVSKSCEQSLVESLMSNTTAHPRFLNYHGEYGARLENGQSVHGDAPHPRSHLITIVAPLLFNIPHSHIRSLETVWVDGTVTHLPWIKLVTDLRMKWQRAVFAVRPTLLLTSRSMLTPGR